MWFIHPLVHAASSTNTGPHALPHTGGALACCPCSAVGAACSPGHRQGHAEVRAGGEGSHPDWRGEPWGDRNGLGKTRFGGVEWSEGEESLGKRPGSSGSSCVCSALRGRRLGHPGLYLGHPQAGAQPQRAAFLLPGQGSPNGHILGEPEPDFTPGSSGLLDLRGLWK